MEHRPHVERAPRAMRHQSCTLGILFCAMLLPRRDHLVMAAKSALVCVSRELIDQRAYSEPHCSFWDSI